MSDRAETLLRGSTGRWSLEPDVLSIGGFDTQCWSAGEGPTVVCVHGGGPGADAWGNWYLAGPLLAEHGFRVVAPDMVGFGGSAKPSRDAFGYTNVDRAVHLHDVVAAISDRSVVVIGNSMGGAASIELARRWPAAVAGLVLVGSAGLTPRSGTAGLGTLGAYDGSIASMRRVVAALMADGAQVDEDVVRHRQEIMDDPLAAAAFAATMKAWTTPERFQFADDELRSLQLPALVVGGELDRVVSWQTAVRFFELIPRADLLLVAGAGHWPMMERPAYFADAVASWLTTIGYGERATR